MTHVVIVLHYLLFNVGLIMQLTTEVASKIAVV